MIVWRIIRIGSVFIDKISNQIRDEGYISLNVFVCPSYSPKALFSENPEEYVWDRVLDKDLFTPRIPKIDSIITDIRKIGLSVKLNLLCGDSDPQEYIFPFLKERGISIDSKKYFQRVKSYVGSLNNRVKKIWNNSVETISFTELEISSEGTPRYYVEQKDQENRFFSWLFSKDGPYNGLLNFSDLEIDEMIEKKFKLYGAQGWVLNDIVGGIVLQTETPWLLRTQMLKCTGAPVVAIYPWIRKEEKCRNPKTV